VQGRAGQGRTYVSKEHGHTRCMICRYAACRSHGVKQQHSKQHCMQYAQHVHLSCKHQSYGVVYSPLTCKSIADLATAAICGNSLQQ
jgi:hypothetical protein